MLLANDERIAVPDKFRKSFVKPAVYELHSSQIVESTDKWGNKIKKYPRSVGLDTFFSFYDNGKNQMVVLRFAETQQAKKIGGMTQLDYSPTILEFRGMSIICDPAVDKDIELHYFLSNHPRREGSPNFDNKKGALFILQDLAANATKEMSKRKLRHEAEGKIMDVWSDIELEQIALSFGDIAAIGKTADQHREYLSKIADKNPGEFLKQALSEEMSLRGKIVDGITRKILTYNEQEKTWFWGSGTERDAAEICVVRSGEDPKTRLIQYWNKAIKEENLDYFEEKLKAAYEAEAREKEEKANRKKQ